MTASDVRASLQRQLQERGAETPHFLALIDDYMFYYQQEKKMQAAVKKGLTVKAKSAAGKEDDKENPKAAALYSKQKLAILRELGLTTDTVPPVDESGGNL